MKKTSLNPNYIPELDGLRGISILAVMVFHANPSWMKGGFIGVDIFFVLSGFLITGILLKEYDTSGKIDFTNFYLKRLLRLGPALLLLLASFSILSMLLLGREKAISNIVDSIITLCYATNWCNAFDFHAPDFLSHTWSLSIEEQFYFIWPILVFSLLRFIKSKKTLIYTVAVFSIVAWGYRALLALGGAPPVRTYHGLDTRADALLIGCVLGMISNYYLVDVRIKERIKKALTYILPLAISVLIFVSFKLSVMNKHMYVWIFYLVGLCAATLVLNCIVNKTSRINCMLRSRTLMWVGSISYGLYLYHFPIYRTMEAMGYSTYMTALFGTIITFICSSASFCFMERPILKMKKKFNTRTANIKPEASMSPNVAPCE